MKIIGKFRCRNEENVNQLKIISLFLSVWVRYKPMTHKMRHRRFGRGRMGEKQSAWSRDTLLHESSVGVSEMKMIVKRKTPENERRED